MSISKSYYSLFSKENLKRFLCNPSAVFTIIFAVVLIKNLEFPHSDYLSLIHCLTFLVEVQL